MREKMAESQNKSDDADKSIFESLNGIQKSASTQYIHKICIQIYKQPLVTLR